MKLEFITSINDYDLSTKQSVFALIFKHKYNRNLCSEVVNVSPKKLNNVRPIDSLALWRLTSSKAKPQDILN